MAEQMAKLAKAAVDYFCQSPHSLLSKPPVSSVKTPTQYLRCRVVTGIRWMISASLDHDASDVVFNHDSS